MAETEAQRKKRLRGKGNVTFGDVTKGISKSFGEFANNPAALEHTRQLRARAGDTAAQGGKVHETGERVTPAQTPERLSPLRGPVPPSVDSRLPGLPPQVRRQIQAQQEEANTLRPVQNTGQRLANNGVPESLIKQRPGLTYLNRGEAIPTREGSLKILRDQGIQNFGPRDTALGRQALGGAQVQNTGPRNRVTNNNSGRQFGHNADGSIIGSTPREIKQAERTARDQLRSARNFGGARGAEARIGIGKQLQDARDEYYGREVDRRAQDTVSNTAFRAQDTDLLRTQLQQQGLNDRFSLGEQGADRRTLLREQGLDRRQGTQAGLTQEAVDLESYRRNAYVTEVDKNGNVRNREDIQGFRNIENMFGGERETRRLIDQGKLSPDLLRGLHQLRNNLNTSEAYQEAETSIRNLPEFQGISEAEWGDLFNNGIGVLDILFGKGVLRGEGVPAVLKEDAFRNTGLTPEDIAAIAPLIEQGR